MQVTYYGHSCFSVLVAGKNLLFDPFVSQNELAKHVDVASIPADYIFISHGHFDHMSDALAIAKRTGAKLVSGFEVGEWFQKQGLTNVHLMNHGGKWKFDFGTVKLVNAVHSSVLPDGTYGGNPVGFVIESADGNFYYSGDTALTMDMQLIPRICEKLYMALLPIGDNFTMGIEDAVIASEFVECDKIVGLHYDTFGYIKVDHELAARKFESAAKELYLLNIGESRDI